MYSLTTPQVTWRELYVHLHILTKYHNVILYDHHYDLKYYIVIIYEAFYELLKDVKINTRVVTLLAFYDVKIVQIK